MINGNGSILDIAAEDRFKLTDAFLDNYINKQPDWGPLGYITYLRTYARPKEDGTREEYWETCKRVVEGVYTIQKAHCRRYHTPWQAHKAQKSAQKMFMLMWDFKFLPPGRGLWMMGTDYVYEKGGASLNNCAFVSTKDIHVDFAGPFLFMMDMSMMGVGVGANALLDFSPWYDFKGAGTVQIKEPRQGEYTFVVEDSREGWCELTKMILDAYVGKASLPKEVDYSKVRPYGVPIKGFGGTASGPEPLMQLVEDIHKILSPLQGQNITTAAIVDLFNAVGKCVVAGNVRRSAQIMFGDSDDTSFLELKDYDKNPERNLDWGWASNNSILSRVGMDYSEPAERTEKNGEPGYFWLENARRYSRMGREPDNKDRRAEGCNPCGEQTLESFELCCLVETFPARHETLDEYLDTLKYAYLYAKTVTLVPTHNARTNAVMLRNRRIGTSQSGIQQSINKHGLREHFRWCDEGYNHLKNLDAQYSEWLCVPRSIKITSVKPSGTVSLLPGATPGIHFPHSEFYMRTIRFSKGSPLVAALKKAGHLVEDDVANKTAVVVYFPVKEEHFCRGKNDVTIWEQMEIAAQMQECWADNQVSVTVTFDKEKEGPQIKNVLELYETRLKAVSFLPLSDHKYAQAPYQECTKEQYEKAVKKLKPFTLDVEKDVNTEKGGKFCDGDICEI